MSADVLRRAASLMRSRATGAAPLWGVAPARVDINRVGTCDDCSQRTLLVASYPDPTSEPWLCADCAASVDHTASWHPVVALAVADWLEVTERDTGSSSLAYHAALAVARAYLGPGA